MNFVSGFDYEYKDPDTDRTTINDQGESPITGIVGGKDINEYILNDYTTNQIVQMIDRFTFEGLQATFQLKMWQKI